MKKVSVYWLVVLAGMLALSAYPLYMGFRVITDMMAQGTVMKEDFPKYIIPYTPISLAVLCAPLVMPLVRKWKSKWNVFLAFALALAVFFLAEWLFESKVIVTATVTTRLESWQMYMCYIPPESFETRTWTAVDILMGEYSPLWKVHFYLISVVLILSMTNCLYGFARAIETKNRGLFPSLVLQSVCTAGFLALCILACFTAFFRDGSLQVSPLSAALMCCFFALLGITAGLYIGSFLRERGRVIIPGLVASGVTLVMYLGELFLLSGHLYQLGTGFLFDSIPGIVLSLADILVIASSGLLTALLCRLIHKKA